MERFRQGDTKIHSFTVIEKHFPDFNKQVVHEVCSTYSLAREIEWCSRLFVLDILEKDEEGIGTMLTIEHISPAFDLDEVTIIANVLSATQNELICDYVATVGKRIIAKGKTGQKVLKRKELTSRFSELN